MADLPHVDLSAVSRLGMFEESRSFKERNGAAPAARRHAAQPAGARRSETALRAIAWSDLTTRLDAARDLRLALRHDARRNIEGAGASFSDAAAQYFRALEICEPDVNLAALGEHKGSAPIFSGDDGNGAVGDVASASSPRDDARDEQ